MGIGESNLSRREVRVIRVGHPPTPRLRRTSRRAQCRSRETGRRSRVRRSVRRRAAGLVTGRPAPPAPATVSGGIGSSRSRFGRQVTNCTFAGNTAAAHGGAVYVGQGASCEAVNCIFWGNTAPTGGEAYVSNGTMVLAQSSIDGGINGLKCAGHPLLDIGGNRSSSPAFMNTVDPDGADDVPRSADDGYQLSYLSGCLDVADDAQAPTVDVTSSPRPQGFKADLGSYEYDPDYAAEAAVEIKRSAASTSERKAASRPWLIPGRKRRSGHTRRRAPTRRRR